MKALRDLLRPTVTAPPAPPPPALALPPLPPRPAALPDPAAHDPLLAAALPMCWRRRVLLCWGDAPRVTRFMLACGAAGAKAVHAAATGTEAPIHAALATEAAALGRTAPPAWPATPLNGKREVDSRPGLWLGAPPGQGCAHLGMELAVDGSQLVHHEEPLAWLNSLAATGARHLVTETPVVSASGALAGAGFRPGDIWFAGTMTPDMSRAMAAWWTQQGVELEQYRRFPDGFTTSQGHAAGLAVVGWWSFMDRAGLERLLQRAGWRVLRLVPSWNGRSVVAVAERA